MDSCNIPTNIYINLSKAFDTLNFDILLNKLDCYGVQRCANRLIYSYLSERWQFVDFSRHKSSYLPIKTGVPQGPDLGPLLFLIYINDFPLVSNVFDMLMYADDTTLYCNINQNIREELIDAEYEYEYEYEYIRIVTNSDYIAHTKLMCIYMYILVYMYTYNRVTSICIDLSKIKLFVFVFVFVFVRSLGS